MDKRTKTYSGIFLSCFAEDDTIYTPRVKDHTFAYIFSGEVVVTMGEKQIHLHKGDCFFIRKDHRVNTLKRTYGDEEFRGIFLTFRRSFLRDYFSKMERQEVPKKIKKKNMGFVRIDPRPDIVSLFTSLVPYFEANAQPSEKVVALKEQEAVEALLKTDDSFYPVLFDFSEPWKIDIMQFMNENYMYELSLEEIAKYTGRSLATFKRDFNRISDMPPQKWLIKKRLDAAYDMMKSRGMKAAEVYTKVGFKNLSHFYTAFKREFGFSPRKQ